VPEPSEDLRAVVGVAFAEARREQSPILSTPHLFVALIEADRVVAALLRAQDIDPQHICERLRAALSQRKVAPDVEPQLTARAAASLKRAAALASREGAPEITEQHLAAAILQEDDQSITVEVLRDCGVDVKAMRS